MVGGRVASRRAVLALGAGAIGVTAGCIGGQKSPVSASGSAAEVPADTVARADYEHVETATRTANVTLTVTLEADVQGRESKDVAASVPVARYRRSTDDGPATVAVAASPLVQVVENPPESRDPLSTLSTRGLVGFVQSGYGEPDGLEEVGTRTVEMLGTDVEMVTHHGTATDDGEDVAVAVHVARVDDGADVVTAVAIHPREVDEGDRIAVLLAGLVH